MIKLGLIAAAALVAGGELGTDPYQHLGWLSGHWRGEGAAKAGGREWHEEVWSAPAGLRMTGRGRTGVGTVVRSTESLTIRPGAGGATMLEARPAGQKPHSFRRRPSTGERELVFEDPYHDYPQRITYRREGDVLTATISRMDGSRAVSWVYRLQPPEH